MRQPSPWLTFLKIKIENESHKYKKGFISFEKFLVFLLTNDVIVKPFFKKFWGVIAISFYQENTTKMSTS